MRTSGEALQSLAHWPFTHAGTAVVLVSCSLIIAATFTALLVCHHDENCASDAWPESVFGPQREFEKNNDNETAQGWCEMKEADVLLEQDANALSNLGFCGFGLLAIACGVGDAIRESSVAPILARRSPVYGSKGDYVESVRRNHLSTFPVFSILYGLSSVFLGIGSFMLHAYTSDLNQVLDVGGIFVALAAPMWYTALLLLDVNAGRKRILFARALVICGLILTDVLMVVYKWEIGTMAAMLGMIAAIAIVTLGVTVLRNSRWSGKVYRPQAKWHFRGWRFLLLAVLSLVIGFICWQLDKTGVWCNPTSFFQGHSLWHLFCGLALLFTYLFLRSEVVMYSEDLENESSGEKLVEEKEVQGPTSLKRNLEERETSGAINLV